MPRGRKKKFKISPPIKADTAKSLLAITLVLLSIISLISFFVPDYSLNQKIQEVLRGVFGYPSFIVPFILFIFGLMLISSIKIRIKEPRFLIGLLILLFVFAGLFHIVVPAGDRADFADEGRGGGLVGYKIASVLVDNVSIYGGFAVLFVGLFVGLIILADISLDQVVTFAHAITPSVNLKNLLPKFEKKPDQGQKPSTEDDMEISTGGLPLLQLEDLSQSETSSFESGLGRDNDENDEETREPIVELVPPPSEPQGNQLAAVDGSTSIMSLDSTPVKPEFDFTDKIWRNPTLDLLTDPPAETLDTSDTDIRAKIIKDTLKSFGIDVEISDVKIGSSVTQYSLQPKSVTKVSKIASLQENLAMALASPTGSVRVEAPIPGKSLIGIEVPNSNRSMVYFKSLMMSEAMKGMKSKIGIGLGKDVGGRTYTYDIAKMPHLLIAGATGSGKSVFIHNILFSILFRASPQEVKFIMIDPKRVEMIYYQDIPHLLTPVVTDMEKAPSVFRWAAAEMDRRYKLFEQAKARNIEAYNEKSGFQALPYIVIIVDELAEIMIQDPVGVEKSIIRLGQLARATGIHLVLAVQRPSTNIITGLIKANIPCRAAFNVTSQIDSRVIIDQPGAEKLLGKGDMLFVPPDVQKPIRLQGAYISDKEIANLVNFLKSQGVAPDYRQEVLQMTGDRGSKGGTSNWGDDVEDDLFDEAVEIIMSSGKASASLLQRKLSIGYARAARLIDIMEEKGIIGSAMGGSKARDVLMDRGGDFGSLPADHDAHFGD